MRKPLIGSSTGYIELQKLLASGLSSDARFGIEVAMSSDGNTLLIGAFTESDSPEIDNGAAYVFVRSGNTYTQQARLLASDKESSAAFGRSVAISSDGNTALIGASGEDSSSYSSNGAAYVFTRSGSTWTQQQKLLASDLQTNDFFGISVSLSADGNTALVGASGESTTPTVYNGAAYVFTRSGGTWTEQQKLLASDKGSFDDFGTSVALSSNGDTALIGALNNSEPPLSYNGAAYVFTRSGGTWTQQQKLSASDKVSSDNFGVSVDLSADGDTALIGAFDVSTSPLSNNGAAYVFIRSSGTWTEQQKLLANDRATIDYFGESVALSADGNTALIGAPGESTSPRLGNGAAYVFTRSGSNWSEQQKLLARDYSTNEDFGRSVAISTDANTVLIGAFLEDTFPYTNNGAAYIFIA